MDWTTVAVTAVGLLLSGAGGVTSFLYFDVRRKADGARVAAEKAAADAETKIAAVTAALNEHRLYVAEHYVTSDDLSKSIETLNRTIEGLAQGIRDMTTSFSSKLDSLHSRLDGKADKP